MIHQVWNMHTSDQLKKCAITVTLRGRIKETVQTLRKQDPALPENRALNKCKECFEQVWSMF